MAILSVNGLSHGFSEKLVLDNINFSIDERSHVALIGVNGSGKTTLFRMLTGEYTPDEGSVVKGRFTKLGYMEQVTLDGSRTVYEETVSVFDDLARMELELEALHQQIENEGASDKLLEKQHMLTEKFNDEGGLTFRNRTVSALTGLGFDSGMQQQEVGTLSGGQRSKVQLCKLLLSGANLLLLDEPTNHLDMAATEWLEGFLLSYPGAYIVISHDRYFLDRVTNITMEIENHKLSIFPASYSRFMELKKERRELDIKHNEQTMKEIKRIEGIVEQQKRWNQAHNYVTAASKQKQADRLAETLVEIEKLPEELHFHFDVREGGANEVISADRLAMSYGEKKVFEDICMKVLKKEKVFLIGPNGCGKSTLLKVLASKIPGKAGSFLIGSNIELGYFDQTLASLHPQKTAMEEIWDRYPKMTPTEVRSALAIFLFKGEDVFKKVETLSGGEKARLALLNLMLSKANLLLLDEPTNHLDIASREALEQALMQYEGTLLIVSHDRYFINKLADRLYYMDEGKLTQYLGNYDYYEQHRPEKTPEKTERKAKSAQAESYKQRKERESNARKRKTKIERTEARLEQITLEQEELNATLSTPEVAAEYEKVLELTAQLDALSNEETELYSLLEELYAEEEAESAAL